MITLFDPFTSKKYCSNLYQFSALILSIVLASGCVQDQQNNGNLVSTKNTILSQNPIGDKGQFAPTTFVRAQQNKQYGICSFYSLTNYLHEGNKLNNKQLDGKELVLKHVSQYFLDSITKYPTIGEIEQYHPSFENIVSPQAKIEKIAEGFSWSEGPVWVQELNSLLFSDVPENKVYAWSDIHGISTLLDPSGYTGTKPSQGEQGSNGLVLDADGNLILCQHGDRQVAQLLTSYSDNKPKYKTLISRYADKRFNSPNDLCYDGAGNLYFTDPPYGLNKNSNAAELNFDGIYRLDKKNQLKLISKKHKFPNGIAISEDGQTMYVAFSDPKKPVWRKYKLDKEGNILEESIFFDATKLVKKSISKQLPDGLKTDDKGNLFASGPDGILIFSPEGTHLGTIKTNKRTSNCAFAENFRYLYITCDDYLLRVELRPFQKS